MKNATDDSATWKPDILDDAVFKRTLEHAKLAFSHTQDVIKFVDSKCNVLTVLTTAISGFALTLAKWNFELPKTSAASYSLIFQNFPWAKWVMLPLFLVSLIASVVCITACLWSLIARSAAKSTFSVLFPHPRNLSPNEHANLVAERMGGISEGQILHEFNEQLRTLGIIVKEKINQSRMAGKAATVQIIALTLAVVIYVVLFAIKS